jgi:hypothetical protein
MEELRVKRRKLGSAPSKSLEQADLEYRNLKNSKRRELEQQLEHVVLGFKVDWQEFHDRLHDVFESPLVEEETQTQAQGVLKRMSEVCKHDHRHCRSILEGMGLEQRKIMACLFYFEAQGQQCDCKVWFNLDMENPEPLSRLSVACAKCGCDYDEFYMVHDHVWAAGSLDKYDGWLCVGCLENRLGRKLRPDDFNDAPINREIATDQSLRLRDRLGRAA